MTSKTLDTQLQQYWPLLEKEEKQSILTFIKSFIKHKEVLPQRITIDEYNISIDQAVNRVQAGNYDTQEQVEEMSKQW